MTTLKRLALILAAALLVVGATLTWTQLVPASNNSAQRQPPALALDAGPALTAGLRPEGEHAAGELLQNVLIVGALTAGAAGASRLRDRIQAAAGSSARATSR